MKQKFQILNLKLLAKNFKLSQIIIYIFKLLYLSSFSNNNCFYYHLSLLLIINYSLSQTY